MCSKRMKNLKKKVLLADTTHPLLEKKLNEMGFECVDFNGTAPEELYGIIGQFTGIIIRSKFVIDKDFIDRAINMKFIGRVGSGMESIDVAYAKQKGIACLNSPEGNRDAVGEHTLGLLLCLVNKIALADSQIRKGIWVREENRGLEIKGKTIGIIGYGHMGSAFAKCVSGLGARVMAYDKYKKGYSDTFVEETGLNTLFNEADILSLHVPLTAETEYMVDLNFINKFQKSVFLVNTSRGKVVKTKDLVSALKDGKITGAALDVIEYEDVSFQKLYVAQFPEPYTFLCQAPNVVLTPHVAGWTNESKIKLVEVLADKIKKLNL